MASTSTSLILLFGLLSFQSEDVRGDLDIMGGNFLDMDMDLGGFNFESLGSMGSLKSIGEAGDAEEAFKKDQKSLKGIFFKKGVDKKGSELGLEKSAQKKGSAVAKEAKGESGEWNSGQEKKQEVSDALGYKGKKIEAKEGAKKGEARAKKGHKKNHVIRGYKTTKQIDENTKTEEIFDDELDEGMQKAFKDEKNDFAKAAKSGEKGEKVEMKAGAAQEKKEGHVEKGHKAAKEEAFEKKESAEKKGGKQGSFETKEANKEAVEAGHEAEKKAAKFKHL